jgi:hypothetical protein
MKWLVGIILVAALSGAACSRSGSGTDLNKTASPASPVATVANHPDESAAAKAMLLTVNDFPAGWSEEAKSETKSPLDKCAPPPPTEKTGGAKTGSFSSGNTDSVSESLAVYTTAAVAANITPDQASVACFTKTINGGALDDDTAKYNGASISPLSFPALGDASSAYRLKLHVQLKGQTGLGSEADAYIDLINVSKGRVGFTVTAFSVLSPFDTTVLQQFAQKALAKVTAP